MFTVTPASGSPETVFTFDANGSSDPDEESRFLQVRWDWENDGVWDTIWSAKKTRSYTFGSTGHYQVSMEIRDSWGSTSTVSKEVLVGSPPLPLFTISPESASIDTVFRFDASGSSHPVLPADSLSCRWDWEDDGTWDTDWDLVKQTTHQYSVPGIYTITMEIVDTRGILALTEQELVVTPHNDPPVAAFTVTPTSGSAATVFQLDASGSTDLQDTTMFLSVRWDFESDGTWDTAYTTYKTTTTSYQSAGTYSITLKVRDTSGVADSTSHEVTVSNDSPTAIFTHSPVDGTTATTINFDASGCSDPESGIDDLEVRWDFEGDGTWDSDWSTEKTASHRFDVASTYSTTIAVRDPGGEESTWSGQVTIANQVFGAVLWSAIVGSTVYHTPAIAADGTIYLSTDTAILHSYTPGGVENWKITNLPGSNSSPSIGDDGTIYVGGPDGRLVAFDSAGNLLWKFQVPNPIGDTRASPALGLDGTIYTSCFSDTMYALNSDGTIKWMFPTGRHISSSPAIGQDGTIYFGSRDDRVYALNPDGTLRWDYRTGDEVLSSPALGVGGDIFIGSDDGRLYSFSSSSNLQWWYPFPSGHSYLTPVIGASDAVYMTCPSGNLRVIYPNGVLFWSVQYFEETWLDTRCNPLVDLQENVYVADVDLHAYSQEGVKVGFVSFDTGRVGAMTLGPDGVLYLVSDDTLYAIQTNSGGLEDSTWPKFQSDLRNTGRR